MPPPSSASLPCNNAWVNVGPPLSANGPIEEAVNSVPELLQYTCDLVEILLALNVN